MTSRFPSVTGSLLMAMIIILAILKPFLILTRLKSMEARENVFGLIMIVRKENIFIAKIGHY